MAPRNRKPVAARPGRNTSERAGEITHPIVVLILSLALICVARANAWFFFGLDIEKTELWSIVGIGTSSGVLYEFLPPTSKKYLADLLRRYLSSTWCARVLSVAVVILLLPVMTIGYVDVSWQGTPALAVQLNSSRETLQPDDTSAPTHTKRFYGHTFSSVDVKLDNWADRKVLYPLDRQVIQIPLSMSISTSPDITEIEQQLESSFFQFFESRYLDQAHEKLSSLVSTNELKPYVERLKIIHEILHVDFLESDAANRKGQLLENFLNRYPNDPWKELLEAANFYGNKDYRHCAEALHAQPQGVESPDSATADFFRGVCWLKVSRDESVPDKKSALNRLAVTQFKSSEDKSGSSRHAMYKSLALPSAILFQGIADYYFERTGDALSMFAKAEKLSAGGLRARALNDIGYIQLSRGNLEDAENALIQAMDNDSSFPLARSNYGYVLMGKGDFPKARNIFSKNASDERLKMESYRDVVLAKLALAHLSELEGARITDSLALYEPILSDSKIQTFDGVSPDMFRLACIHNTIAKKIYLSKDYYGLEVYALALLTRAYFEVEEVVHSGAKDARVIALREELLANIEATKAMVSSDWLQRPQRGWFSTIDRYQKSRVSSAQSVAAG